MIGIVAGEASGDLLGGHLVTALRSHLPDANFVGIGGPKMKAAGVECLFPTEKLAVRGYAEVLKHYPEIVNIRRKLKSFFLANKPKLFIGIDAPDFNLDLELQLKTNGIPTVHYVSPSIWAWRGERIHKIKRAVSHMLALFPFEKSLYEAAGIPVTYVGHPLADMLDGTFNRTEARLQMKLSEKDAIVALLPGSRRSELRYMADLFVQTALRVQQQYPGILFLAPLLSRETKALFEEAIYQNEAQHLNIKILFGHAHQAMAAADIVLVASGTASLEAALLGRPMVITYKVAPLTWWLSKGKNYLPYVGLPNIMAEKFIVPEFLQHEATAENLAQALTNLLKDETIIKRLEKQFDEMRQQLRQQADQKAALAVLPYLKAEAA